MLRYSRMEKFTSSIQLFQVDSNLNFAMPVSIDGPPSTIHIHAVALSQKAFQDFGDVIENPAPSLIPSLKPKNLPLNAVQANQGTALKFLDISSMRDMYSFASSKKAGKAVMNMFVCAPRVLLPSEEPSDLGCFQVQLLERHPFTSQTFIPLGLSASEASKCRYLVIVAPSLKPSPADEGLPVPSPSSNSAPLPGRGLPDLSRIKAFTVNGSQAVTYGPGTWHAPMVVIGDKPIDFVVVQFSSGVAVEDCQEAEIDPSSGGNRSQILVGVPKAELTKIQRLWKL